MNYRAIGVFDSGVGGFGVLGAMITLLPNENFVYLADTARVPYGTKPRRAVVEFSIDNTKWLLRKDVKIVVVACNTVSVIAGMMIRKNSPVPVVTMTDIPQDAFGPNTGLIGTRHMVESAAYPKAKIRQACPNLVEVVEKGILAGDEVEDEVAKSLQGLENLDTLILGCSHYTALRPIIQKHTKAVLFDPAQAVAQRVKHTITQLDLLNDKGQGKVDYYFTGKRRGVCV